MELAKHSETEIEFWEIIEGLGGLIYDTNRGMSHGRIEYSEEIANELIEAQKLLEGLVVELCEKFGVIHKKDTPKTELGQKRPPAPEGKIYYWDWYEKMKEVSYKKDYENIICSACPFSEGLKRMIDLGGIIPCRIFHGSIYQLRFPYECGMVYAGNWDEGKLHKKIVQKSMWKGWMKFRNKRNELKEKFEKEPSE